MSTIESGLSNIKLRARIHELEAELAKRMVYEDSAVKELNDALAAAREEPEIHVRWDKDGWTNTHPVRLVAETDGYIDWPMTLKVARYQPDTSTLNENESSLRDPEDGMTDKEAADALYDAVMKGRGQDAGGGESHE